MPIFITDEELSSLHPNNNNNNDIVTLIISKADSYITNLQRQLETVKAQSDASSITAEQTCSLLEQKYISLSSDFEKLEKLNDQLHKSIEQNLEELAVIKSEKHQLHLNSIEKDGAIERLSAQVLETHKSKRQLLSMIEQKDSEITEKNTTINTYLDRIDASKKAHEKLVVWAKYLEEQLDVSRKEIISLRLERDKLSMVSKFAQDKLDGFMKEFEHQRVEMNRILSRNVEFSQLVVDYQRKVHETSDSLQAAEDLSRKLTMEVSQLKCEKESLLNSEKRAYDEARNLSKRIHNLQTSMETKHCVEEAREEARVKEQRKQEEHINTIESIEGLITDTAKVSLERLQEILLSQDTHATLIASLSTQVASMREEQLRQGEEQRHQRSIVDKIVYRIG